MEIKDLVGLLARNLVEHPDKVEVTETAGEGQSATFLIRVADEDKGKIIGKQGKVVKALRALVGAVATKAGKKTVVDLE